MAVAEDEENKDDRETGKQEGVSYLRDIASKGDQVRENAGTPAQKESGSAGRKPPQGTCCNHGGGTVEEAECKQGPGGAGGPHERNEVDEKGDHTQDTEYDR
jgi:hypothetical protein